MEREHQCAQLLTSYCPRSKDRETGEAQHKASLPRHDPSNPPLPSGPPPISIPCQHYKHYWEFISGVIQDEVMLVPLQRPSSAPLAMDTLLLLSLCTYWRTFPIQTLPHPRTELECFGEITNLSRGWLFLVTPAASSVSLEALGTNSMCSSHAEVTMGFRFLFPKMYKWLIAEEFLSFRPTLS